MTKVSTKKRVNVVITASVFAAIVSLAAGSVVLWHFIFRRTSLQITTASVVHLPNGRCTTLKSSDDGSVIITSVLGRDSQAISVQNVSDKLPFWRRDFKRDSVVSTAISGSGNVFSLSYRIDLGGGQRSSDRECYAVEVYSMPFGDRLMEAVSDKRIKVLQLSSRGEYLVAADKADQIFVYESSGGRLLRRFKESQFDSGSVGVHSIAISPDNQKIAVNINNVIRILPVVGENGDLTLMGHKMTVMGLEFSRSDNHRLYSIGNDLTARVWDTITGKQIDSFSHGFDFGADGILESDCQQAAILYGARACVREAFDKEKYTYTELGALIVDLSTKTTRELISPSESYVIIQPVKSIRAFFVVDKSGVTRLWRY